MPSLEAYRFSQKYPYTSTARSLIKELNISLANIPEDALIRARVMVEYAASGKEYFIEGKYTSTSMLENEILAFPTAKLFLSLLNSPPLYEKFAAMVSKSTLSYLSKEDNRRDMLIKLASDLELNFTLSENRNFFAEIKLLDFLKINFNSENLKLVNQKVENGTVFLDENDFTQFLSENVFMKIVGSMPVDVKSTPPNMRKVSKELALELIYSQRRSFEEVFTGKINPGAFPPCVSEIYNALLEGKNISHTSRFYLATFLTAAGMPASNIAELFKKAPNYKESITKYQVERISGKQGPKYAPPSCSKIKEYNLCNSKTCNVKHPLGYYRRNLKVKKKAGVEENA